MATQTKRATIYFDPDLHKALRLKAVETARSVSDLVNEAVKEALAEDAEDLAAFDARAGEPRTGEISFAPRAISDRVFNPR